ncbi:MAG: type II toxin-antitoxin system PemK/MazF family toxin [Armatimonadota bacterium]|nr:type II toxin-antitoxin system PemK/MazF family toxin [Armatimonadota bacterium]
MRIHKGDVFLANLDPAFGHEQHGRRPVLVVQNDIANDVLPTVMVAPLTGATQAARFPSTILIPAGEAGLTKDSIGLLFQIRTLDKRRLEKRLGRVSAAVLTQIDDALRESFGV